MVGASPTGLHYVEEANVSIGRMAHLYRIQVHKLLKTERDEFDHCQLIGKPMQRKRESMSQVDHHQADVLSWFRAAIFARTPGQLVTS